MKSNYWSAMQTLVAITLLATISRSAISESHFDQWETEIINEVSTQYASGYCTKLAESEHYDDTAKRALLLIANEDILLFLSDHESSTVTSRWIKNSSAFQMGRNVNESFFKFADYAETMKDARAIILDDAKGINDELKKLGMTNNDFTTLASPKLMAEIKKINQSSKEPMATRTQKEASRDIIKLIVRPTFCIIYQIVMDEKSKPATDFSKYALRVRQKTTQKSLDDLRENLEELENL